MLQKSWTLFLPQRELNTEGVDLILHGKKSFLGCFLQIMRRMDLQCSVPSVKKYNQVTKRKSWIEIPCCLFRRDKMREHQCSKCHFDYVHAESLAASAKVTCSIVLVMEVNWLPLSR